MLQAILVLREKKEPREKQVLKGHSAFLGLKVTKENKDIEVHKDFRERKANKALLALQGRKEMLDRRAQQDTTDRLA